VTGVDLSASSLEHARKTDFTARVRYEVADAYELPFDDATFDSVVCFDLLEHVSEPLRVIEQAARVLRSGGLFFYQTLNRNWLSNWVAIRGVRFFVRQVPEKLHVHELLIRPQEMRAMLTLHRLRIEEERGLRPRLNSSFWKLLLTGRVDSRFEFCWTRNQLISYAGLAEKIRP
jgi:2-polyprenyl-6-hydroxyphenyl methylase/3-demethylubiquinone-9 3-methyltransferase